MKKFVRNTVIILTIVTILTGSLWAMGSSETSDAEAVASASPAPPNPSGSTVPGETVTAVEVDITSLSADEVFDYSTKDLAAYTPTDALTEITLSEESVTISEAGIYLISGTLENGQIIVDAPKEADVILILDGVDITSIDSAPVLVKQADKLIISLAEGSENTLTDLDSGSLDEEDFVAEAVIYSKEDLTITGSGSLTVNAHRNNGIQGKDDVTLISGNIIIHSVDDGIVGKDSLVIKDASVTIISEGDGLKSTNDESEDVGYIAIEGGEIAIQAQLDAVQSAGSLLITGGDFVLTTGSGTYSEEVSRKGMKTARNLTVTGGNFTLRASDDALHSDDSLLIDGGSFLIATADDALHADNTLSIRSGSITIEQAYEGIESAMISVSGGIIDMVTSDDGFNASEGGAGSEGFFRNAAPTQGGSNALLQISGGMISLTAGGDGLDSNGSILMSGGEVTVYGPTDNANGSIDYDYSFTMSGGLLITAGSSGMVQSPSESSSQLSVVMTYSSTQASGTAVTLLDSEGNAVASVTPNTSFQTVLFSTSDIEEGSSFTIVTDGEQTVSFTAGDGSTWLNESGVTTASNGMAGGGMRPPRGGFRN